MTRSAPDIPHLLEALRDAKVQFVLAGSVAMQAWGANVGTPGDLDIIPATDEANLQHLAGVLDDIEADAFPVTGEWKLVNGISRWQEYADDDPRRNMPFLQPDPTDIHSFDTLFSTRFGTLDIVPEISGWYVEMAQRAAILTVPGAGGVAVMSIDDLLSHLEDSNRQKDIRRIAELRLIQGQQ